MILEEKKRERDEKDFFLSPHRSTLTCKLLVGRALPRASAAEIKQLDDVGVCANQDVLQLHVPVENAALGAVEQGADQLSHHPSGQGLADTAAAVQAEGQEVLAGLGSLQHQGVLGLQVEPVQHVEDVRALRSGADALHQGHLQGERTLELRLERDWGTGRGKEEMRRK